MAEYAITLTTTTSAKLSTLTITDGQVISLSDTDGWYYDMGGVRHSASGVKSVSTLPASGESGFVYIYNSDLYVWDGTQFVGGASNKADKVSGATAGNFAGLDASGNLTDSGKKPADYPVTFTGTTAEWAAEPNKTRYQIINITDDYSSEGNCVPQYATMPEPTVDSLGKIVQFSGSTGTYTNGYFYKCTSSGGGTPTYNWTQTNVQPGLTSVDADDVNYTDTYELGVNNVQAMIDTTWNAFNNILFPRSLKFGGPHDFSQNHASGLLEEEYENYVYTPSDNTTSTSPFYGETQGAEVKVYKGDIITVAKVSSNPNTYKFFLFSPKRIWEVTQYSANLITSGGVYTALTNYIQKSATSGLVKNDGTIDTNTYLTATDISGKQDIIQYSTLPTANADNLGKIVQFIGTTGTYTNGYFYKCVSDGAASPTYSWTQTNVQPGLTSVAAADVTYNNSTSQLVATNVQAAVDELKSGLGTAAAKSSTNAVTQGSTALVESGAVYSYIDTAITQVLNTTY